jgi:hypothetical protein
MPSLAGPHSRWTELCDTQAHQAAGAGPSQTSSLRISHDADGNTILEGLVADYAALYGLLSKARDLGLPLLAVNRLEEPTPGAGSVV